MMFLGFLLILAGVVVAGYPLGFFGTSISLPLSEAHGFALAIVGGGGAIVTGIGVLIYAVVK